MRSQLLAAITTACSTLTQFSVSQELPWSQNAEPLYRKNMRKIYVDHETLEQTTLFPVLSGDEVFSNIQTCRVYVCVDAKNPPSQTEGLITKILGAKNSTGIVAYDYESDYDIEIDEDRQIYTFEFRFTIATT